MIERSFLLGARHNKPTLSINLSFITIASENTIDIIIGAARKFDYPVDKVIFEIAERWK
ncbi:MAG: hypothetical protein R3E95_15270 [Thiolinea sp.]